MSYIKFVPLVISLVLCIGLIVCYTLRPDACAAVTIWPAWAWLLPGGLLLSLGRTKRWRRRTLGVGLCWLLFVMAFAEEPYTLLRLGKPKAGERIRVVSLNCAGGSPLAAAEVIRYRPDIVLLQESPGREEVGKLARKLFGRDAGVAWGVDASILARGSVKQTEPSRHTALDFTQAIVRLAPETEVEVVSLRLIPPVFRLDLWSRQCWKEYAENRRAREDQLMLIEAHLRRTPGNRPMIVGGDFNAPAGDHMFKLLRRRLQDAFTEAGRGWGNTAINDFPVVRIDQIWLNKHLRAVDVRAKRTVHSDHRMVVCDVVLRNH